MDKELIIVGIDPGITTAYAILNLKGQLIGLKSSKDLNLSSLTSEIIEVGKVIAVGSDVRHVPRFIDKFSTRVGAKLICPEEDMKIGFKMRLTNNYKVQDAHQRDALASAVFAYHELNPLILRVNSTLKEKGLEHLRDEVMGLTIKGVSISEAISILEEEPEIKKQKKRIRSKIKKSNRIIDENLMLKQENQFAYNKIKDLKVRLAILKRDIQDIAEKKTQDKLEIKDRKIQTQAKEIFTLKNEISILSSKRDQLKDIAARIASSANSRYIITKKFKTLGEAAAAFNSEAIFVDDANSFSEKAVESIKEKSIAVICKSKPPMVLLKMGIKIVEASNLPTEEIDDLVIIERESLEREIAKSKKDIIYKIVDEYRQSRPEPV